MQKLIKIQLFLFLLCWAVTSNVYALNSVSASLGEGEPNQLRGGRLAAQWNWGWHKSVNSNWQFVGYWDLSIAYWHSQGNTGGQHKQLGVLAVAPVFRFIKAQPYAATSLQPYIEASVGPSYLTANHIGRRNLGAQFAFQDLLGAGVVFGNQQQWDVSYSFLHYSNANLRQPNQGIDVKALLTLRYIIQ